MIDIIKRIPKSLFIFSLACFDYAFTCAGIYFGYLREFNNLIEFNVYRSLILLVILLSLSYVEYKKAFKNALKVILLAYSILNIYHITLVIVFIMSK